MNWNIRAMTAADVPQVAAMERACFSDPWPEQVIAKELENELSLWLVAAKGEMVLGYVGSQTVLGEADMMNLAVGAELLTLEVRDSNEAAIRLYAALGFTEIGRRPNYYFHPKEDARILRKDLTA